MISVCIATYNGGQFIKEQLDSILVQLSEHDEIIVSDDHSDDDTLTLISNYKDNRIKIFINQNEKGYTKNFENAISRATGDIIFICDQDDVWMNNKVQRMVEALETCQLAICNAKIVDGSLNLIDESHFELHHVRKGFWVNYLQTRYIGACMAFKKEILQKALPFPNNQKLCAHDYWLTLIAEFYYKVGLVEEPLIQYRRHGNNVLTGGTVSTNSTLKKVKTRIYSLYQLIKR